MEHYHFGKLVANDDLPRKNNMYYEKSYDRLGKRVYGIYSYHTLIGFYDIAKNEFIEWAHDIKYSPTTSKQATTLGNYLHHMKQTTYIRATYEQAMQIYAARGYYIELL